MSATGKDGHLQALPWEDDSAQSGDGSHGADDSQLEDFCFRDEDSAFTTAGQSADLPASAAQAAPRLRTCLDFETLGADPAPLQSQRSPYEYPPPQDHENDASLILSSPDPIFMDTAPEAEITGTALPPLAQMPELAPANDLIPTAPPTAPRPAPTLVVTETQGPTSSPQVEAAPPFIAAPEDIAAAAPPAPEPEPEPALEPAPEPEPEAAPIPLPIATAPPAPEPHSSEPATPAFAPPPPRPAVRESLPQVEAASAAPLARPATRAKAEPARTAQNPRRIPPVAALVLLGGVGLVAGAFIGSSGMNETPETAAPPQQTAFNAPPQAAEPAQTAPAIPSVLVAETVSEDIAPAPDQPQVQFSIAAPETQAPDAGTAPALPSAASQIAAPAPAPGTTGLAAVQPQDSHDGVPTAQDSPAPVEPPEVHIAVAMPQTSAAAEGSQQANLAWTSDAAPAVQTAPRAGAGQTLAATQAADTANITIPERPARGPALTPNIQFEIAAPSPGAQPAETPLATASLPIAAAPEPAAPDSAATLFEVQDDAAPLPSFEAATDPLPQVATAALNSAPLNAEDDTLIALGSEPLQLSRPPNAAAPEPMPAARAADAHAERPDQPQPLRLAALSPQLSEQITRSDAAPTPLANPTSAALAERLSLPAPLPTALPATDSTARFELAQSVALAALSPRLSERQPLAETATPRIDRETAPQLASASTATLPEARTTDALPLADTANPKPLPLRPAVLPDARWAPQLDFELVAHDTDKGLMVRAIDGGDLPGWAQNETILVTTANHQKVPTVEHFYAAISGAQVDPDSAVGKVELVLLQNGLPQKTITHEIQFQRVFETPGGTRFEAQFNGRRWKTEVTAVGIDTSLQVGDKIVRDFATKQTLSGPTSPEDVLSWAREQDIELVEFAILRGGAVTSAGITADGSLFQP